MASLSYGVPLKAEELQLILTNIKNGRRSWGEENELLLIKSMMEHIGSPDGVLRDNLIYGTFSKLTLEKQLDHGLLTEILDFCLSDKMLFKGIGESETDTVFTRSFTALLIALILYRDGEEGFLSQHMVFQVKDKLLAYIKQENDLRGFVAEKSWAHSIAHVADAFDELVKNKYIKQDLYMEILHSLWKKIYVSTSIYIHDEEERLLVPIMEMLNRGLEYKVIENMLEDISTELKEQKALLPEENYLILYANCKKFLKSFYVIVDNQKSLSSLKLSIKEKLLNL